MSSSNLLLLGKPVNSHGHRRPGGVCCMHVEYEDKAVLYICDLCTLLALVCSSVLS